MKHIEEMLDILERNSFYAKMSKCEFGMTEILYQGNTGVGYPQESDTIEGICRPMQLLQKIREGVLAACNTIDQPNEEGSLLVESHNPTGI